MTGILVLRPEPGGERSAERARALGLRPVLAPIFTLRPLDWEAPDPDTVDAVLITSANAARLAGPGLAPFLGRRCFAVGPTSAREAVRAGFDAVATGPSDMAAAVELAARSGTRTLLHPCGREHKALDHPDLKIERRVVYAAEAAEALPEAASGALRDGAPVLLHSPRAAALFAELAARAGIARRDVVLVAISRDAAGAAGEGWRSIHVAAEPRDEALLELAAKLCNNGRSDTGTGG